MVPNQRINVNMKKNILISGVCGFIGSNLAEYLINKKYNVIGIDNFSTGLIENIDKIIDNDNFKFIEHDIKEKIFLDIKIDFWVPKIHFGDPNNPFMGFQNQFWGPPNPFWGSILGSYWHHKSINNLLKCFVISKTSQNRYWHFFICIHS